MYLYAHIMIMYYSINHNTCMFKYIIFIASYEVQIDGINYLL